MHYFFAPILLLLCCCCCFWTGISAPAAATTQQAIDGDGKKTGNHDGSDANATNANGGQPAFEITTEQLRKAKELPVELMTAVVEKLTEAEQKAIVRVDNKASDKNEFAPALLVYVIVNKMTPDERNKTRMFQQQLQLHLNNGSATTANITHLPPPPSSPETRAFLSTSLVASCALSIANYDVLFGPDGKVDPVEGRAFAFAFAEQAVVHLPSVQAEGVNNACAPAVVSKTKAEILAERVVWVDQLVAKARTIVATAIDA